ncbi:Tat pathway signal protein [Elioraea sp.]|uniref:Tat pathway signal protein n=1 Tax=Elioraea sp. TaxID=2185103 RepID=UPI0025BF296B|nr:Tat pathway signal protein [Elioraea sp.]
MLRRFLPGAFLVLLAALSSPATAQNPDFWVVNSSGKTIHQVYVSSAQVTNWGNDLLGQNVLATGQRFAIRPARDGTCLFDIRVVYADNSVAEQRRINTCNINEVIFTAQGPVARGPQGPQGTTSPSGPNPDFRLVNRSGRTITEVYVSSSQQQSWGPDRLGQNVLGAGQSMVVNLPRDGNCVFDLRVVYDNNTATERRQVNTCNVTEITFP